MFADNPSPDAGLLRTSEAAAALGCTRQHIGNLIRAGRLEGINIGPGERTTWRVTSDSLARYVVEVNQ